MAADPAAMVASTGDSTAGGGSEPKRKVSGSSRRRRRRARARGELGLASASFLGLLMTQFLGAANDNVLRWLVIGIGKELVPSERQELVLALGTALFVLPYLILAALAGYLGDRFSKRQVIVWCKVAEIGIMTLAVFAILSGSLAFLFVVVGVMGAQSALFGPSKLGSIPEMLTPSRISAANGVIGMTTVIATTIGAGVGMMLADLVNQTAYGWSWAGGVLIGVATLGWLASLPIARLPVANPERRFPWDSVQQTLRDLKTLAGSRAMLRVALGVMFFWSLGALAQLNIDQFAFEGNAENQAQVSPLLISLVIGVGLGSVLAGFWSAGRVELGILPLGAGGLVISSVLLFAVEGPLFDATDSWTVNYALACGFLFLLGTSAGLFDVPLASFMQHRSPTRSRGSILAASNFLTFAGILLFAILFVVLRWPIETVAADGTPQTEPLFSARTIFLLCGLGTIPVFVYIVWLIPQASIRFVVWLAAHTIYDIRVVGRENLPREGGALLVSNHVSWADGALLLITSSRPIRFIIAEEILNRPWKRALARSMGMIPIRPTPKATRKALETARTAIENGELVCIFPEGGITRSGMLQPFKPGAMQIVDATEAPTIPVYLDEMWGSILSFERGKLLWKIPREFPKRVSIWFGERLRDPQNIQAVRQSVQDLGATAAAGRKARMVNLPRLMLRRCRNSLFRWKLAESSGAKLSGGTLLMRTLILRRLLKRELLGADEEYVGVLLPPSLGGVVVNTALTLDRRVTVNLNYTVSSPVMNACIERAGLRHVLTSRRVIEKLDLQMNCEVVCLEDLREKITLADKLAGILGAYLVPVFILERWLGLTKIRDDDVLTVIFTSGSTGIPKGVMLSHHNVGSNVEAVDQVVHLTRDDTFLGILPFFHSFGYLVAVWTVLAYDVRCAYHFTPLDARAIGKLIEKWGVNIAVATPTFLRSYMKRCTPEQLKSLELAIAGAEQLPKSLCDAFEEKFGFRPVEGYGCTELSPLVSVNVPASRSVSHEVDLKEGTVGRPVPGVSTRIVDPETFEPLETGEAGMLMVKGPNVMLGYMGEAEKTAEVIRDGWYVTGDIARLDGDGFIEITGRLSRFSKIGGEMVPHLKIEEAIEAIVEASERESGEDHVADEAAVHVAVTAVSDERKGERLVVLHGRLNLEPDEIREALKQAGLPNLWIPSADSFVEVDAIPVLGTGKRDLKAMRDLASAAFAAA